MPPHGGLQHHRPRHSSASRLTMGNLQRPHASLTAKYFPPWVARVKNLSSPLYLPETTCQAVPSVALIGQLVGSDTPFSGVEGGDKKAITVIGVRHKAQRALDRKQAFSRGMRGKVPLYSPPTRLKCACISVCFPEGLCHAAPAALLTGKKTVPIGHPP